MHPSEKKNGCSLHRTRVQQLLVLLFYFIYVKTTTTTTTTILYSMYILVRVVSENRDVLAVVACAADSHYKFAEAPSELNFPKPAFIITCILA